MRVLVAEDHERLAKAVAAGLRRYGMTVDASLNGDDALARLGANRYDVVVLDRYLPGVHGDANPPCAGRGAVREPGGDARRRQFGARATGSRGSPWGPTTTCPSRSTSPRWWPGCRRWAPARRPHARTPGVRRPAGGPRATACGARRARPGAQPEGVRRARVPVGGRRPAGVGGGVVGAGVGPRGRPVHHDGQSHRQPVAGEIKGTRHSLRPSVNAATASEGSDGRRTSHFSYRSAVAAPPGCGYLAAPPVSS